MHTNKRTGLIPSGLALALCLTTFGLTTFGLSACGSTQIAGTNNAGNEKEDGLLGGESKPNAAEIIPK